MASHADGIAGFSLKSNALATPTMAREMRRATRLEPMITLRRPGGPWIRFNILSTSKGISPSQTELKLLPLSADFISTDRVIAG